MGIEEKSLHDFEAGLPPRLLKGSRPTANYIALSSSVFATAATFLGQALRVTIHEQSAEQFQKDPLVVYGLAGITVLLYWSKTNRLLNITTRLVVAQQALVALWLLLIILVPTSISMSYMHR